MLSRYVRTAVIAGVSVLALATSGCATTPAPVASADAADGDATVTVYSGRNETLVKPVLDAFTAATGISTEVRYGDTAQLAAQLIEEGARTKAHVFLAQDAGGLGAVAGSGLLTELPAATLESVPAAYRDAEGRWVGVTGRSRVLVYNSAKVAEADLPDSVFDLTAPEWKGRVGIAPTNASFQSFVTALRVVHGEDKAKEFLTGLVANEPQIREKNGQIVADVEAGTIDVGLVNHYYVYELAAEKDVPVTELTTRQHFFTDGDIGALVNVSGVGLLANQPDSDGQALVDYLLSTEGQTYFAQTTSEYPLVAGVAAPASLPPLDALGAPNVDLNDLDDLAATIALIKEVGLL